MAHGTNITFVDATLDNGIWTSQCDPNTIDRIHDGQNATFANESTGKVLKASGSVRLIIGCMYVLNIYWEDPWSGKNIYLVYISPSNSPYVVEEGSSGSGNNAIQTITIRKR
ncbi:10348_t:CDS:2 [Dentiscutata erythropus]|uniref:10348_t:CDS:1 n=1 Tax=Dentiscutata erythropus TaxID=1348616 RepID=A0A9N9F2K4_9GLOM|nr:10348_t:CDS:2 [Dentiscutata erythropus]